MKTSVIIPVLNEEKNILECLDQFDKFKNESFEIIVCDGGSTDNTLSLLKKRSDILLCETETGRGQQMNKGTEIAQGDVFLFLHADSFLPDEAFSSIETTLKDKNVVGGFFKNKMFGQENEGFWFRFFSHFLTLRSRLSKNPYGDMGIFVREVIFKKIEGYQPIPIMEDVDFSKRLIKEGKIVRIPYILKTSVRRFKGKLLKTVLLMFFIKLGFNLGVSPYKLAKLYKNIR